MGDARDNPSDEAGARSRADRVVLIQWVQHIRWAALVVCLVAMTVLSNVVDLGPSDAYAARATIAALLVLLAIGCYNAFFVLYARRPARMADAGRRRAAAAGQVVCDTVAALLLVHLTGGVESVFAFLLILPPLGAAMMLGRTGGYVAAGAAIAGFHAVGWGELAGWIRHVDVPGVGPATLHADVGHVAAVTGGLTVVAALVAAATGAMSDLLTKRSRQLDRAAGEEGDGVRTFFLTRARHEMRAPLAAIHSILEAISHHYKGLNEVQVRMVERAIHRTEALMSLLDDLRRYSRLDRGDDGLEIERLSLDELVDQTCELFAAQARRAGVELTCRTQAAWIDGDGELLRELLTNLTANALQYTPRGGRARLELSCDDRAAVLSVSDTGIGISADALPHVFDQFYRAPEAKETFADGTGLGLVICRRIAELHGGRIEASGNADGGATFTVRLPLPERHAAAPGGKLDARDA